MNWDELFLGGAAASEKAYRRAIEAATEAVSRHVVGQARPFCGGTPDETERSLAELDFAPETGGSLEQVIQRLGDVVLARTVLAANPSCAAHLHCPPLIPALAAEVLLTAANPSMDSWDQSGAATLVEQRMVNWLSELFGYDSAADGTFTSGGTQSNFMGMLLARDAYAAKRLGWRIQSKGLPPEASRFRILASEAAHFSVRQSAMLLGLGDQAVVPVAADAEGRISIEALDQALEQLDAAGLLPIAISATAGTTDFGSIDPLLALAERAKTHGLWLHVDAAYGGALALSERHRHRLAGIAAADSITVDFHKLWYQPISCGAFLVKDATQFDLIRLHADYLNPASDEALGLPNLVTKSIQTTRRFDALKLVATLQTMGREGLAAMVDYTIDLAAEVSRRIDADPELERKSRPSINTVVFRYRPAADLPEEVLGRVNGQIRQALLESGDAVVAHTQVAGQTCLKFTLLNPLTTVGHIEEILSKVKRLGAKFLAQDWSPSR